MSFIDEAPGGIDWSSIDPPQDSDPFEPAPFTPDQMLQDGAPTEPSPSLLRTPRKPTHAKEYKDKTNDLLQVAIAFTAPREATVADAATILLYGERVSDAMGELAAENAQVATVLDFLSGGTGNVYTAAVMAMAPFVCQLIRNHEPSLEHVNKIKIPFTKRYIKLGRIKFRLGHRVRVMTSEPAEVYQYIFGDDKVLASMKKKGIPVAAYNGRHYSTDQ